MFSVTIISTVLGLLTSSVPRLIDYLSKKREMQHEVELLKLKIEATSKGLELNREITEIRAIVDEGNNIRDNDAQLDGGNLINTLRASVRPVITYALFGLFIGVKFCVAFIILMNGTLTIENMKLALDAILDENTMAIFSTILGYYFGARSLEKMQSTVTSEVLPSSKLNKVINNK